MNIHIHHHYHTENNNDLHAKLDKIIKLLEQPDLNAAIKAESDKLSKSTDDLKETVEKNKQE